MTFIDTASTAPLQTHYPGSAPQEWAAGLGRVTDPAALNPIPVNLLLRRNKAFPTHSFGFYSQTTTPSPCPTPQLRLQRKARDLRLTFGAGKGHHPG